MRLFTQTAPPLYLNHILTWNVLPAKQFARPAEAVEHIPANIREYIETEPEKVGINIPLTATRYYLRNAERGLQCLLKSLRIDPKAWSFCPKSPDALDLFFEQSRIREEFLWVQTDVGQKIVDDLVQFHRSHAGALQLFGDWMRARSWSTRGESWGEQDPYRGRPDELPQSIERLQRHVLSRIALARKAINCSVRAFDGEDKRVLMAAGIAKAVDAYVDDGLRAEFDAMPLELSVRRFLGD